jgi:hypothetical protein
MAPTRPRSASALLLTCGATLMLVGCSFSFGGLDYDKLETQITDELNASYSSLDQKVSSVDCPEQSPTPEAGDTFECIAQVGDQAVRVDVTVDDEDYNVTYTTRDTLYELPMVATTLADEVSRQVGFPVTVDCGEGLKSVEAGKTFDCAAADPEGTERTVRVTVEPGDKGESWELID